MAPLRWVVFVALCGLVAFAAAGTLFWPMGRDQGIFAWTGDAICAGGMPYRDAWDVKGPAGPYTYALAQCLFGRSLWGIRAIDLLFLAAASVGVWLIVRRAAGTSAAHAAALLHVCLYLLQRPAAGGYWDTAQPDAWGAMAATGALALLAGPRRCGHAHRVGAGVLLGIAVLYKWLLVGFVVPLVVYDLMARRGPGRSQIARVGELLVGCAAVVALSVAYLAARGALGEFLGIQLGFNWTIHARAQHRPVSMHLRILWAFFGRWGMLCALALAAFGAVGWWRRRRALVAALVVWVAAAFAFVWIQNKYYPYHWAPLQAALAVLAGLGLRRLRVRTAAALRRGAGRSAAGAAEALALGASVLLVALNVRTLNRGGWRAFVTGSLPRDDYWLSFGGYYRGGFCFLANARLAEYLKQRTAEDDAVLVWGFEPLSNYLSGRRPPTRFGYHYPLTADPQNRYVRRYRKEFLEALRSHPPAYVVVFDQDPNNLTPRPSRAYLEDFAELSAFLRSGYVHEATIERAELWRRAHRPPLGPPVTYLAPEGQAEGYVEFYSAETAAGLPGARGDAPILMAVPGRSVIIGRLKAAAALEDRAGRCRVALEAGTHVFAVAPPGEAQRPAAVRVTVGAGTLTPVKVRFRGGGAPPELSVKDVLLFGRSEAVRMLLRRLHSAGWEDRWFAAYLLGQLDAATGAGSSPEQTARLAGEVLPRLEELARSDSSPEVRRMARLAGEELRRRPSGPGP